MIPQVAHCRRFHRDTSVSHKSFNVNRIPAGSAVYLRRSATPYLLNPLHPFPVYGIEQNMCVNDQRHWVLFYDRFKRFSIGQVDWGTPHIEHRQVERVAHPAFAAGWLYSVTING